MKLLTPSKPLELLIKITYLVIVNGVGSTATREADDVIITRAGPEIGVAAKNLCKSVNCDLSHGDIMGGNDDLLKTLENMLTTWRKLSRLRSNKGNRWKI